MFKTPNVIHDARKGNESEAKIQEGVVQGVLRETGLPSLANVVQGVGKSPFPGNDGRSTQAALLPMSASDRQATPQKLGSVRYAATQTKKYGR